MCVPNPPLYSKPSKGDNSKPATYLIRVKTAEDADELFSQLNKSKTTSNWYFYSKLDGSEKTEKFTVWLKGTKFFFQIHWWLRENLDNQNHFILQSNWIAPQESNLFTYLDIHSYNFLSDKLPLNKNKINTGS